MHRMKGERGDRIRGGALGLGLLMGGAVFSHGLRRGCEKAEILAINDDGGSSQGYGARAGDTVLHWYLQRSLSYASPATHQLSQLTE